MGLRLTALALLQALTVPIGLEHSTLKLKAQGPSCVAKELFECLGSLPIGSKVVPFGGYLIGS